jgi:hypothetical protein
MLSKGSSIARAIETKMAGGQRGVKGSPVTNVCRFCRWPQRSLLEHPERGFIIQPRVEAPGFRGGASTLGQPAQTISNPESGCFTQSARTHARTSAGLNVCGGCSLAASIMRTPTIHVLRKPASRVSYQVGCASGWFESELWLADKRGGRGSIWSQLPSNVND